jgi:hypothetical protein
LKSIDEELLREAIICSHGVQKQQLSSCLSKASNESIIGPIAAQVKTINITLVSAAAATEITIVGSSAI